MTFSWLTKVKGDELYIAEDNRLTPRSEAIMEHKAKAEQRAARKFGPQWQDHCELIEADWSEWSAFIGRRGGKKMTPIKYEHLKRISKRKRRRARIARPRTSYRRKPGPKKKRGPKLHLHWWWKDSYAVCAPRVILANRFLRRVLKEGFRGVLRDRWNTCAPTEGMKSKPGVYQKQGISWFRIL